MKRKRKKEEPGETKREEVIKPRHEGRTPSRDWEVVPLFETQVEGQVCGSGCG
jgi:hypothetical protein